MASERKRRTGKAGETAEKLAEQLAGQTEEKMKQARRQALKTALQLVELQQKTFDGAFKLIEQLQDHSEESVRNTLEGADWMPDEGKQVVEEWVNTLRKGSSAFEKTIDKSFGLVSKYLERVQRETGAPKKKPAKKKAAAKKLTAKKKSTARKTPAKKKTAPKKKPAAKKKSAAKKKTATKGRSAAKRKAR